MTADKANTIVAWCVVDLTKQAMGRERWQRGAADRMPYSTELYKILANPESRLFLEDEEYLRRAYDTETSAGVEALYEFIKPES